MPDGAYFMKGESKMDPTTSRTPNEIAMETISPMFQDCDILICQGNSWLSTKIAWTQKLMGYPLPDRNSTHVALIVRLNMNEVKRLESSCGCFINADPNDLYVFETTTLNKWCGKKGLQINPFGRWLENYNGTVGVRRLEFDRTETRKNLMKFIAQHITDPKAKQYESGILGGLELALCVLGYRKHIIETNRLHCTEVIAECLKTLGLMQNNSAAPDNNRMPPTMWVSGINMKVPIGKMEELK
jgi:hypothetical protein